MNLERGCRRLFVVLSVGVVGLGLALDAGKLWSHAKIYATLTDGSTEIYDTRNLVGSPPYERDPATRKMVADLVGASVPVQTQRGLGALARFREKYPQYADIPDQELARRIVEKYPEYRDILGDVAAGTTTRKAGAPLKASDFKPVPKADKIPPPPAGFVLDEPQKPALSDPLEGAVRIDPSLKTFRVVLGPGAWSWEDVRFTPIAGGVVVLLWAGFFGARWVVRGFAS
jgi:hypothetical protein